MPDKNISKESPPPVPDPQRRTILVVEDQALIAMMIENILVPWGYEVVIANDGESALKLAASISDLSAIIADIQLFGQMDGKAVIRSLRSNHPILPAVVVTGFDGEAPEANLRGLGGPTIRLSKPFSPDDLVASLTDVLSSTNGRAGDPSDRSMQRRNQ